MARDRTRLRLYSLLDVLAEGARIEEFGQLAVRLAEAKRNGANVADTWVVPTLAFRMQVDERLPPGHDMASLIRAAHKPSGVERAARAYERLTAEPLPDLLTESIVSQVSGSATPFRAMASLGHKDPSVASLSGLDAEIVQSDMASAIRAVWARGYSEQCLRTLQSMGARDLGVAVVVQRVPALRASLQLLTAEPERLPRMSRERPPAVATGGAWVMVAGLGPSLHVEQGALLADQVVLDGDSAPVCAVADKRVQSALSEKGLEAHAVEEHRREPAVEEPEIVHIREDAAKIGDTEPVLAGYEVESSGAARLTSVRGVLGAAYPGSGGPHTVWSRSGLDALLPRVPTPLTGGLVAQASEASLREAIAQLGGKMSRSSHLVENVHGRPYFDLSALFGVVKSVPGLDPSALLDLVRGASSADVITALELERKVPSLAALSLVAARLLSRERRLHDAQNEFERRAGEQRKWLLEMDLTILPDDALRTTLRECFGFFRSTAGLLLSSSLAFLSAFVAVRAVIARSYPAEASRLAHRVCSGAGELETTVSAVALGHVVDILREDVAAHDALEAGSEPQEWPEGAGRRALQQWLSAYGDRGWTEPEIAAPRFSEQLPRVYDMLRANLAASPDLAARMSRVRAHSDEAIARLEEAQSYLEVTLFRSLLGRARGLLSVRERCRVWLAQTVSMLRTVVMDVDRRLRRLDPQLREGAAFFLEPEELMHAISVSRADLGSVVRWRRAGFKLVADRADPPELFVGRPPPFPTVDPRQQLGGEGASSALGEGEVRHLSLSTGMGDVAPNTILVVRSLDVGLAPLLPAVAGVIAECGGTLSHGAIVAREMGVPAVVGARGARALLAQGERVRIDGNTGSIERV
ncbi:MAG: PEP-utilizing enzyme [Polyangiaceae bacterium]